MHVWYLFVLTQQKNSMTETKEQSTYTLPTVLWLVCEHSWSGAVPCMHMLEVESSAAWKEKKGKGQLKTHQK